MIFALGGNQNCGKTTLFNQLTGSNQHVGNFPGVTVEGKSGTVKGHPEVTVVDLPGIYSLSPYTSEEIVTRDYLINEKIDCIINITDATNIERNLYLSLQLMELDIPMVIALNMMDEMRENGNTIEIKKMSEYLGVPVVPLAAIKNEGVEELIETAVYIAQTRQKPLVKDFCSGAVHRAIHSVAHLVEDHADRINVPPRFAATKLIEGDSPMLNSLQLSENEKDMLEHIVTEMETELGTDREAALADMRYDFIERVCSKSVIKNGESKAHARSVKIDSILTHRIWAIPIFIGIMAIIFWLTFGLVGAFLSDGFTVIIDSIIALIDKGLTSYGINPVVHSLIVDGVCAGVGSVLSFLPTIVVLFFFFVDVRGQRLYGKSSICNGQGAPKGRTFWKVFCTNDNRIRMLCTGNNGKPHFTFGQRQKNDDNVDSVYELLCKASDIYSFCTSLHSSAISRSCNDRIVCIRNGNGGNCWTCP